MIWLGWLFFYLTVGLWFTVDSKAHVGVWHGSNVEKVGVAIGLVVCVFVAVPIVAGVLIVRGVRALLG